MRFFFYGTLMDVDLLSAVIGRRVPPTALKPALLRGFRRLAPNAFPYPIVISDKSGSVKGVIIDGITPNEQKRLIAYEGAGYEMVRVTVQTGTRQVKAYFFSGVTGEYPQTKKFWSLKEWRKRHKIGAISEILKEKLRRN